MARVIAIVGHSLLVAFVAFSVLIEAGPAPGALMKAAQLVLLVGCVGSVVVLVRRGGQGRGVVILFNGMLLVFAALAVAGLAYYELRYGGQQLIAGLLAIAFVAVPPSLSLLELTRVRGKSVFS
jgi:hypothetical protein